MNDIANKDLLPAGLQDLLPPDAAREADIGARLLASFHSHGYERVKPPFIEFEDSLLSGTGADLAASSFRLMDPISHHMMALRSDMTPQVARIARTRLARSPRPLRLSYGGDILRVEGSELRPERQFAQVGFELIGAASPQADAEIILLAVEALSALGVQNLTVDLNAPTLVTAIIDQLELDAKNHTALRAALDLKDGSGVAALGGAAVAQLNDLLGATGAAGPALEALTKLDLPKEAQAAATSLCDVARLVLEASPGLAMTIDPVERRGFEYQTGVSFTLFASGVRGELGRGGRYPLGTGETATGVTLFLNPLLQAAKRLDRTPSVYIPLEAAQSGTRLRADGWRTVTGLEIDSDANAEAKRLRCSHILRNKKPEAIV